MIEIYQVDAFTDCLFGGNPAAVVPLPSWPDDTLLQSIAAENNLAETAYIVQQNGSWQIRWFTPLAEVALCGHATLAAAHVAFQHLGHNGESISFATRESGVLDVGVLDDGRMMMQFPAIAVEPSSLVESVGAALGCKPQSVWKGHYSASQFDLLAVVQSETELLSLKTNEPLFAVLGSRGVIATAPSSHYDFVSRYFGPCFGIPEDPVTGSAHCLLAPFWADKLNKHVLQARQLSQRGGDLECHVTTDQVALIGNAVDYMKGRLCLSV